MLGIELVGAPFERRGLLRLADRRAAMRVRRLRVLGFAVPTFLLLAIPFAGVVVFPVCHSRRHHPRPSAPRRAHVACQLTKGLFMSELSVQLYTVREALEQDFDGTLARIAGLVHQVEPFALPSSRTNCATGWPKTA